MILVEEQPEDLSALSRESNDGYPEMLSRIDYSILHYGDQLIVARRINSIWVTGEDQL